MKKTLIPGMFSSISDAELVTAMLDAAELNEDMSTPNSDSNLAAGKHSDELLS